MSQRIGRGFSLACSFTSATALLLMSACGGGGPTSNTPPTTLPPPPQVLLEVNHELPAGFAGAELFTTTRAGTIVATVDYTFPDSGILVWLARGECTEEMFFADQCPFAATSLSGARPRTLTVPGASVGVYTFIVGNLGPQDEAIAMQVVFTPSASAANARPDPGTSLTPATARGWIGRRIPGRGGR